MNKYIHKKIRRIKAFFNTLGIATMIGYEVYRIIFLGVNYCNTEAIEKCKHSKTVTIVLAIFTFLLENGDTIEGTKYCNMHFEVGCRNALDEEYVVAKVGFEQS